MDITVFWGSSRFGKMDLVYLLGPASIALPTNNAALYMVSVFDKALLANSELHKDHYHCR